VLLRYKLRQRAGLIAPIADEPLALRAGREEEEPDGRHHRDEDGHQQPDAQALEQRGTPRRPSNRKGGLDCQGGAPVATG